MRNLIAGCPAEKTLSVISGRWKIFILLRPLEKAQRFAELRKAINAGTQKDITAKILAQEQKRVVVFVRLFHKVFPKMRSYTRRRLAINSPPDLHDLTLRRESVTLAGTHRGIQGVRTKMAAGN